MISESAAVKIERLKCGYPSGFCLDGVSMKFERGFVSALVGPNGSGKSTVLKAATGILPIQDGLVEIDGVHVQDIPRATLARKIAVVAQESAVPFEMSVVEYVQLGRIPHRGAFCFHASRRDYEISMEKLDVAGVSSMASRRLDELSGGERQLVHMARALAQEPQIIFLDEPTNHLDISHQQSIMRLVRRLAADGLAVALVLHDLNLASGFCDIVYLLDRGRLVISGPPEKVISAERIAEIYRAKVRSFPNPENGKPLIFIS